MISSSAALESSIVLCVSFILTIILFVILIKKFKNVFSDNNVFLIIIGIVVIIFECIIATLLIHFFI